MALTDARQYATPKIVGYPQERHCEAVEAVLATSNVVSRTASRTGVAILAAILWLAWLVRAVLARAGVAATREGAGAEA